MGEEVRSIPGYPGYLATADGRIISTRTNPHRALAAILHKGYLHVNVKTGKGRKTKKKEPVHKLVLLAFYGPKPSDDMECRHLDGNSLNNRPDNLRWGTRSENVRDQINHGTAVCLRLGEDHPRTKLKFEQVVRIKKMIGEGFSNMEIAKAVEVERHTVQDIRVGKSWNHIPQGA